MVGSRQHCCDRGEHPRLSELQGLLPRARGNSARPERPLQSRPRRHTEQRALAGPCRDRRNLGHRVRRPHLRRRYRRVRLLLGLRRRRPARRQPHHSRLTPHEYGKSTSWFQLSAGAQHKLWNQDGRHAVCWGCNAYGELRDGTTTTYMVAHRVPGNAYWLAVSAGSDHTCGLHQDNTVWCWGDNTYGQVGDSTTADRRRPVKVKVPAQARPKPSKLRLPALPRERHSPLFPRSGL